MAIANPKFETLMLSRKSTPLTWMTLSTDGLRMMISVAWSTTASVRDSDAPGGSSKIVKYQPWSSSGTKFVGRSMVSQTVRKKSPANPSITSSQPFESRCTMRV